MAKRFLVLIALLMLGFFIAGCAEGDKRSSVTNPNPDVFTPTGSISGTVFDACGLAPVSGATVSVAYNGKVHTVKTGAAGAFSFSGVPANGSACSESDAYYVTCDLTTVTGNPYGYTTAMPAWVIYSDLGDGKNKNESDSGTFTESGSGASTPVNGLAATVPFIVAKPNASITGVIYSSTTPDLATGYATPAILGGATVNLYRRISAYGVDIDSFLQTATSDATTGAYSFTGLIPGFEGSDGPSSMISDIVYSITYYVQVMKAGYDTSVNVTSIGTALPAQPVCGQSIAFNETLTLSTTPDLYRPFIMSVVVAPDGQTEAQGGTFYDDILDPAATTTTPSTSVATLSINFNEAMNQNHTVKDAIGVEADFTVTLTSAGPASPLILTDHNIVADFSVAWTSGGTTLLITPTYETVAQLLTDESSAWVPANVTATYSPGIYYLDLSTALNLDHLYDLALNRWDPDPYDSGAGDVTQNPNWAGFWEHNFYRIFYGSTGPYDYELEFGLGQQTF